MSRIVFDIGGTHMRVSTALEDGIGPVVRVHTPGNPDEALELLVRHAHELSPEGISLLAGGVAGKLDIDGSIVRATNLPAWDGYTFKQSLSDLADAPVQVRNDAELAGLGEATYGAGKGENTVAYIGIGTGVGMSCIVAGNIQAHTSEGTGRAAVLTLESGEWLEELIGGHALTAKHGVPPEDLPSELWQELTPLLVEGVENAIRAWTPDVVVLGGSLMSEGSGFRIVDVQKAVGDAVPIRRALLGDNSGLHGAKALAER